MVSWEMCQPNFFPMSVSRRIETSKTSTEFPGYWGFCHSEKIVGIKNSHNDGLNIQFIFRLKGMQTGKQLSIDIFAL